MVFCGKCKYYNSNDGWEDTCSHPDLVRIEHSAVWERIHELNCHKINKHNDCSHFCPNLWERLIKNFKKCLIYLKRNQNQIN